MTEDEQGMTVPCPHCGEDMKARNTMAVCLDCGLVIKKPLFSQTDMVEMIGNFM